MQEHIIEKVVEDRLERVASYISLDEGQDAQENDAAIELKDD